MTEVLGAFIRFVDRGLTMSGKTRVWHVETKEGAVMLGMVHWYGPWRKYCYSPSPDTVYEEVCLREIAAFCVAQTTEHRTKVRTAVREGATHEAD